MLKFEQDVRDQAPLTLLKMEEEEKKGQGPKGAKPKKEKTAPKITKKQLAAQQALLKESAEYQLGTPIPIPDIHLFGAKSKPKGKKRAAKEEGEAVDTSSKQSKTDESTLEGIASTPAPDQ